MCHFNFAVRFQQEKRGWIAPLRGHGKLIAFVVVDHGSKHNPSSPAETWRCLEGRQIGFRNGTAIITAFLVEREPVSFKRMRVSNNDGPMWTCVYDDGIVIIPSKNGSKPVAEGTQWTYRGIPEKLNGRRFTVELDRELVSGRCLRRRQRKRLQVAC